MVVLQRADVLPSSVVLSALKVNFDMWGRDDDGNNVDRHIACAHVILSQSGRSCKHAAFLAGCLLLVLVQKCFEIVWQAATLSCQICMWTNKGSLHLVCDSKHS